MVFVMANFLSYCADPTLVGSDLLDDIKANVDVVDTISMVSYTTIGDSVVTFRPYVPFSASPYAGQLQRYLLGSFEDPIYGKSSSSIYVQPRIGIYTNESETDSPPSFANAIYDSLVLVLPYDSAGIYGDINQDFTVEIFRVTEDMPQEALFSNKIFAFANTPIGNVTFRPDTTFRDFYIYESNSTEIQDTLNFRYETLRLDDAFGLELFNQDSSIYRNETSFLDYLNGLYVRAASTNNAALSFDLSTGSFNFQSALEIGSIGGLYLYYHLPDDEVGESRQFYYSFWQSTVRTVLVDIDPTGGKLEEMVNGNALDTVNLVRGVGNVQTVIEFPYLSTLKNVLLNKAELEVFVGQTDNDPYTEFGPLNQLIVFQSDLDGNLALLEDIQILGQTTRDIGENVGGVLLDGENGDPDRYVINITAAMQNMIDGTLQNKIYLSAFSTVQFANHTILNGANHPEYPMNLRVTFVEK